MANTTVELKNIAAPTKIVIIKDLTDCLINIGTSELVSDTNTYSDIRNSESIYDAVTADEIVLIIDSIELSKEESFLYLKDANNFIAEVKTPMIGNAAGAWVLRTTPYKDKCVKVLIQNQDNQESFIGIRKVGSVLALEAICRPENSQIWETNTNGNGEIEIFAEALNVVFHVIGVKLIE